MRAILISIRPEWVAKILNGEKILEIRKNMPKCDFPIDVYIYCTKDKRIHLHKLYDHSTDETLGYSTSYYQADDIKGWEIEPAPMNGEVVAKFTLKEVEEVGYIPRKLFDSDSYYLGDPSSNILSSLLGNPLYEKSCLSKDKLHKYLKGKKGYAWHISNLEIFDKPKELTDFKLPQNCWLEEHDMCKEESCPYYWVENGEYIEKGCTKYDGFERVIKAPQSWRFVDVGE